MTNEISDQSQNRLLIIELIRFVCAITIVLWHYQHFFHITDVNSGFINDYSSAKLPGYSFFTIAYTVGGYAVEAFWVISGFIFFWKYSDVISSKDITFKEFFILRFSRLYPLHFTTLIMVTLLQFLFYYLNGFYSIYPVIDIYHFILNIFMAPGWGIDHGYSYNAPIWSVSAEEIVYALFFVLFFLCKPALWRLLLIVVGCYVAGKLLQRAGTTVGFQVLRCGIFFFLGGIIYFSWLKVPDKYRNKSYIGWMGELPNTLGSLTYSSYLLHFPIMLIFLIATEVLNISKEIYYDWRIWLLYMLVVFSASRLVYLKIERPAQSYLRKRMLKP